ncbi:uncharacterized protein [Montipora capricornis]|uniref:uncharacterized protein n=1 Tax=Montipora capricornis TaxID=246305 RepID=UPI0035F10375
MGQMAVNIIFPLAFLAILSIQNVCSSLVDLDIAPPSTAIRICPMNFPDCNLFEGKVILHRTLFPADLVADASFIDPTGVVISRELRFNTISTSRDLLLRVPLIEAGAFKTNAPLTVKLTIANNVELGTNQQTDILYALSDGSRFVGFDIPDRLNYGGKAPCIGAQGNLINNRARNLNRINPTSPLVTGSPYPGKFEVTIKLNENIGYCYTAQRAGTVKLAPYNDFNKLAVDQGISLVVFKDNAAETYGIVFVEAYISVDDKH